MAGGVAADLFRPALPVTLRADACWAELDPFALEPSGGIEALEDDRRRWWPPGRTKGCWAAARAAGRVKAHTEGGGRVVGARATLPAAEENISSRWRAMMVELFKSARWSAQEGDDPACRESRPARFYSAFSLREPHRHENKPEWSGGPGQHVTGQSIRAPSG